MQRFASKSILDEPLVETLILILRIMSYSSYTRFGKDDGLFHSTIKSSALQMPQKRKRKIGQGQKQGYFMGFIFRTNIAT